MAIAIDRSRPMPPANELGIKAIAAAVTAWEAARNQYRTVANDLAVLERERPQAVSLDLAALADALESGQEDPGEQHTEAHDQILANARRTLDALRLVEERRFLELQTAFDENATELARNTQKKLDAARADFMEALDQLAAAHTALMGTLALDGFARGQGYRSGWVTATRVNGSDVGVDVILGSLRALVPQGEREDLRLVDAA